MTKRQRHRSIDTAATSAVPHPLRPNSTTTAHRKSPYHEVAQLLAKVWGLSGSTAQSSSSSAPRKATNVSLKSVMYDKNGVLKCSKRSYAVATKVLQKKSHLDQALSTVPELTASCGNTSLLYVLLYELLYSPAQKIVGGGAVKRMVLQHERTLRDAVTATASDHSLASNADVSLSFPRYIRVNTCVTTTKKVIQHLQATLSGAANTNTKAADDIIRTTTASPTASIVPLFADPHVPDLLVVPQAATSAVLAAFGNGTDNDKCGNRHSIVLQDKASCLPALCLVDLWQHASPKENSSSPDGTSGGDILDACAAPGNKTSHLAALLHRCKGHDRDDDQSSTTIYALDRNAERVALLQRRLNDLVPTSSSSSSATCCQVVVQHGDFLATVPSDYSNVQAILLDPSCSGSGIYSRGERSLTMDDEDDKVPDDEDPDRRLTKLSGFQTTALRHAMSFDSVHTIVYSTCSIHGMENEGVVAAALHNQRESWRLVAPPCLAHWTRRGQALPSGVDSGGATSLTDSELQCLIRCNEQDETNGFFVSCLQRRGQSPSSTNSVTPRSGGGDGVNADLGIPLYQRGQFAGAGPPSPPPPLPTMPVVSSPQSTLNRKRKSTSPSRSGEKVPSNDRSKRSTAVVAGPTRHESTRETDSNETMPIDNDRHGKKRAKALEWKRRQHQAKLARKQPK
jgi:25S rRNA (cytosine2278-C5)-methyltransferase